MLVEALVRGLAPDGYVIMWGKSEAAPSPDVVWHLIVRMRPFRPMMAPNLRLLGAISRFGRSLVG